MTQARPPEGHLSPETVLAQMKQNGVTHVVWPPDRETSWRFVLMKAEPSLSLVGVNREGLAFSAAAGLFIGGKLPPTLIQNTGLMESGDSLRGWAQVIADTGRSSALPPEDESKGERRKASEA